jgi:flagellar biosynthesis protein FlhA
MRLKFGDMVISIVVIAIVMLIIMPLNPVILDGLLVLNLSISIVILLTTLYIKESLQFSIFPSLLLIVTLFRLSLNVSSTRLILGNNGEAGQVIKTFGSFVVQGNVVVGFVIFLIIVVIQFIVITKGTERVSEVAARFTLDAMPGKQMAIDADMNSGLIDENQARERRIKVQREADFYGAMDGASKFVKGDAIVGIIITIINSLGGIVIGMLSANAMSFTEILNLYILATVGDGLISQIPALLVSTATGIIVTRAASENNMGHDVSKQLLSQPLVLIFTGGVLILLSAIPGLPKLSIFILACVFIYLGYSLHRSGVETARDEIRDIDELKADEIRKPENIASLLYVDPIEIEFGYGIIPMADVNQGGDLLDRVVMIRRQCAMELGMIVPVVRLRDNIQLTPNGYVILIKGVEIAKGEVIPDQYMAMNADNMVEEIDGMDVIEPAFGMPAKWISEDKKEKAEILGYTVVDAPTVIATHLTEIIKRHGYELLGRQEVQTIINNLKETHSSLVDEVIPKILSIGELQKVLSNLLKENVSIRDMVTILETLGDYGEITKDTDILTEYVRQSLKRSITKRFIQGEKASVLTVDPELEQIIMESIQQTEQGTYLNLAPDIIQKILNNMSKEIKKIATIDSRPILLSSPAVRLYIRKISEQMFPDLTVLSYNELEQSVQVQSVGAVNIL